MNFNISLHPPKTQSIVYREISEIKSRRTLAQVLQYSGLKPDKDRRLHCSFHDDKTPGLQVGYKTHMAYCFSSSISQNSLLIDASKKLSFNGLEFDTIHDEPDQLDLLVLDVKRHALYGAYTITQIEHIN